MKTMRTFLNLACALALVLGLFTSPLAVTAMAHLQWAERFADQVTKQAAEAAVDVLANPGVPAELSAAEWAGIQAQIQAAEYRFTRQEQDGQAFYRAFNRTQGFHVAFDAQGFQAASQPASWDFGLTLTAYGGQPVAAADLSAEGTQVTAQHGENLVEWLENRSEGVKHGLTLYAPPDAGALTLDFVLSGNLIAEMTPNGGLCLRSADGVAVLAYDGLAVFDASGRELPAQMTLIPGSLRIAIEGAGASYPITVDPLLYSQTHMLMPPSGQEWDRFGHSVAIDGDTLVVGAFMPSMPKGAVQVIEPQVQEGYAVVFQRNQGGADAWGEVAFLQASDAAEFDHFGYAVAIDGDTIAIGAPDADLVITTTQTNAGVVYLYDRNAGGADNWGEVKILHASDGQAYDNFGDALDLDGDILVVGAPYKGSGFWVESGAAYVFYRNMDGADQWGEVTILESGNQMYDYEVFGSAVAVSGDTIAVGSPGAAWSMGIVYIYQRNEGGGDFWGEVMPVSSINLDPGDAFGSSLALDGNTLVVGAPYEGGGIGDPLSNAGAAYVFERNDPFADVWGEVAVLRPIDAQIGDEFGSKVAVNVDTIVVAAPGEDGGPGDPYYDSGAAYVFDRNQGGAEAWGEINVLRASTVYGYGDYFGSALDISGNTVLIGASGVLTNTGAAYLFEASGTWFEETSVSPGDAQYGDQFGYSVALAGDTLVVGAPHSPGQVDIGAAYVFQRNWGGADAWGEVTILADAGLEWGDQFGYSVAVAGDTIVVGAPFEDGGPGNPIVDAGAAYVFRRNQGGADVWGGVATLSTVSAQANDYFGSAVAIDGDTIVVGVPFQPDSAASGRAYIFQRNQDEADAWGEVTSLTAGVLGDQFGYAVAISDDTIVVGAPYDDWTDSAGNAYVYKRNQSGADAWGQAAVLFASDAQIYDRFGQSVSISGDTVAVGAPREDGGLGNPKPDAGAVYLFRRNQGGADAWGEMIILRASDAQLYDNFGSAVAIAGDSLVVGAPYEGGGPGDPSPGAGAAYVFQRNQGGADAWGQVRSLHNTDSLTGMHFGSAVAISGNTLVSGDLWGGVGWAYSGEAIIFTLQANWEPDPLPTPPQSQPGDLFGSVALDGDILVVGAPDGDACPATSPISNTGSAYIFYYVSGFWTQTALLCASDAAAGDYFGWAVAIYSDTVVIGAPYHDQVLSTTLTDAGAVYVFQRNQGGADAWGQVAALQSAEPQDYEYFGYSMTIDGATIVVGAPGHDGQDGLGDPLPDAGAAYIFVYNAVGVQDWGQVGTLNGGDGAGAGDGFGSAVDLNGSSLAVGAPGEDGGPGDPITDTGMVYLYGFTPPTSTLTAPQDWGQVGTLNGGAGAGEGDGFGSALAQDGGLLAVGAPGNSDVAPDAGAVHMFTYTATQGVNTPTDWGQVGTLNGGAGGGEGDGFGSSVALSGPVVIAGAPFEDGGPGDPISDTGAAYVFVYNPIAPMALNWDMMQTLRSMDAQAGDGFGNLVALDGAIAAIGAPYEDGGITSPLTDTGAVYVFGLVLPNQAPLALDDAFEVLQDSSANPLDVLYNDMDTNSDPLVIVAVGAASHGTVVDNDLNVLYSPDPGFAGEDSFIYIITDGNAGLAIATVNITVQGPPAPDDLMINVLEDTPYTDTLTASDPNGDMIAFTIQTDPLHGTALVAANGVFTYTPAMNYVGADHFAFVVSDGVLTDTGQVSITVIADDCATALALMASPSPSGLGQVVTFTAAVSASLGSPTGTLIFREGTTPLMTTTLDENGMAIFSTDTFTLGEHTISAEYLGAVDHLPSSIALTHTVAYMADLQVSIQAALQPLLVTYIVEIINPGFNAAHGTQVAVTLASDLSDVVWTCVASGGAACTPSGTGDVNDVLTSLPVGGQATYTITARRIDWQRTDATVLVTLPVGYIDPNPDNNQATYPGPFRYLMPLALRNR